MKKISAIGVAVLGIVFLVGIARAQMGSQMMGQGLAAEDDHTAREEAEGKAVWEKLQAKQTECKDLTDEDFGALGEYFMGQMLGEGHAAMNAMMISMMGEEGEETMHVVMGKRLSGCDMNAAFSAGGIGFMPMMNMMMGDMFGGKGGWSSPFGSKNYNMMYGYGSPFGFFGGLSMLLWWAIVIFAVVVLIRWLSGASKGSSVLEILKERYAKGEIDKKEFEEKLKEIRNI